MRTIMEFRKLAFTLCTLLLISTSIKAQVTIGAEKEPHLGAVLELASGDTHGLLLPRLSLTSASAWSLGGNPVEGMTVYNESASTANNLKGKGVYVWTGSAWRISSQLPCSGVAPKPGEITLSTGSPTRNVVFQAWVAPVEGAIKYVWEILGVGMVGYSESNSISLAGSTANNFLISVRAVNACGVGEAVTKQIVIN
jgi:hypothetical protein